MQANERDGLLELFEEAPIPYHELDAEGVIRRVNQAECVALGYEPAEMLGQPIWNFLEPDEREPSREAFYRKLQGMEPLVPFRRTLRAKQGHFISFEVHARRITDEAGQGVGLRMVMVDITHHVEQEEALDEQRHWSRAAIASLHEGILAVDTLGVVRFFNSQATRLLDFSHGTCYLGADMSHCLPNCSIETEVCGVMSLAAFLDASLVEEQSGVAIIEAEDVAPVRVNVTGVPMIGERGSVIGSVMTFREPPGSARFCPVPW
jgi:PAS domain S-box-containing protein